MALNSMNMSERIEVSAIDFQKSLDHVNTGRVSGAVAKDCEHCMAQVKPEEELPLSSNCLDVMSIAKVKPGESSSCMHPHTVRRMKAEAEDEPSALKPKESNDPAKSKDGENSSLGCTCGSLNLLKGDVGTKPFANDCSKTGHLMQDEDGEEFSLAAHRGFMNPIKLEENDGTSGREFQGLTIYSSSEVKEEAVACGPEERGIIECTAAEIVTIGKHNNMNDEEYAGWMKPSQNLSGKDI